MKAKHKERHCIDQRLFERSITANDSGGSLPCLRLVDEFFIQTVSASRPECELISVTKNLDRTLVVDLALDKGFGEFVFDVLLEGAFERAGTVLAVGTGLFDEPGFGLVGENYRQLPAGDDAV